MPHRVRECRLAKTREYGKAAKEASRNAEVLGDRFSLGVYSSRPACSELLRVPGGCVHGHALGGCAAVLTSNDLLIDHPNAQSLTSSRLGFSHLSELILAMVNWNAPFSSLASCRLGLLT